MMLRPPRVLLGLQAGAMLLATAPLALAGDASEPSIYSLRYIAQVFGSLLLVLGCLLGVLYLMKRLHGMPVGEKNALRILGSLKVGAREKILLLEAGDSQLLVGVAAGSVRTLHVFDGPLVDAGDARAPAAGFEAVLQRNTPAGRRA
ncbi:MAG: flagellar biosynthetic protein FliO [Halioglobus sp.]|nr:flagellar biosynthetic protein FliO [Halioglobus sp.]